MCPTGIDTGDTALLEPFPPEAFATQQYLSSVELDQLQLVLAPVWRQNPAQTQSAVPG